MSNVVTKYAATTNENRSATTTKLADAATSTIKNLIIINAFKMLLSPVVKFLNDSMFSTLTIYDRYCHTSLFDEYTVFDLFGKTYYHPSMVRIDNKRILKYKGNYFVLLPEDPTNIDGTHILYFLPYQKEVVMEFITHIKQKYEAKLKGYILSVFSVANEKLPTYKLSDILIPTKSRIKIDVHVNFLKNSWKTTFDTSRSLLFYGKPGTGKTSITYAIANELDAWYKNFPNEHTTGDAETFLSLLREKVSVHTVLVADEANRNPWFSAKPSLKEKLTEKKDLLTTSSRYGCLTDVNDLLSGPGRLKGILTIVISNYPNEFDPSLYRRGRVKECIEIGDVDSDEIVRYIRHHYGDLPELHDVTFTPAFAAGIYSVEEDSEDGPDFVRRLLNNEHVNLEVDFRDQK